MKIRILTLTSLTGLFIAYTAFSIIRSDNYTDEIDKKESYRVAYSDINQLLKMTGVLKPKEQVSVGAQVNGRLNKLHVREGDAVKKGQLLAEIDPTLAQNDVDNAKSELDIQLVKKKVTSLSLKQSLTEYNRQKNLLANDATTLSEFEKVKNKYESDREQLKLNAIQIAQAKVRLSTAQAKLEYTRITSPIDGVVIGILTQEGQTIVSSQSAPTILAVANMDVMSVNIKISEMDILKTRIGMPLWFTVTAAPDIRYDGTLNNIQLIPEEMLQSLHNSSGDSAMSKRNATYYNGSFDVLNEKHTLNPAMSVQVYLIVSNKKNVKVIPTEYLGVNISENSYMINVLRNNEIERRKVDVGIRTAKQTEVVKGLDVGEMILKGDN